MFSGVSIYGLSHFLFDLFLHIVFFWPICVGQETKKLFIVFTKQLSQTS